MYATYGASFHLYSPKAFVVGSDVEIDDVDTVGRAMLYVNTFNPFSAFRTGQTRSSFGGGSVSLDASCVSLSVCLCVRVCVCLYVSCWQK